MSWSPLEESSLWDKLNAAEGRMNPEQARFWEVVRISPQKWKQTPFGEVGGGFWVVAVLGSLVVWYNDIEEGFNYSKYISFGEIAEYWCNQDDLEHALQELLNYVQSGHLSGGRAGPPIAGAFVGA